MSGFVVKARTALALGLPNLWRALRYRLGVKLGLNPVRRLSAQIPRGDFFRRAEPRETTQRQAPSFWYEHHSYFGWYRVKGTSVPNWHENPFSKGVVRQPERPWWLIPDFDEEIGDIKTIWEASRFDWVVVFAQHALNGDPKALSRLNTWLADWVRRNPPYCGPNWKCGQEASIRVMHLSMAAMLLGQISGTTAPLRALVKAHLRRIAPTLSYAIAQDNNHGTSEAAALFIGGSWLLSLDDRDGDKWQREGRLWLENRAARLIGKDGSFSQHSVVYHRLMLDTYSMVECWRRQMQLPIFSQQLVGKLKAATQWLYQMTQVETGDAPNLGGNDGARLLPLSDTDYRDFRPAVQLAAALFCDRCAYEGDGGWNSPLQWLGIPVPVRPIEKLGSVQLDAGGYSLLRRGNAFALLRFPRFRFRPSHADALHVDLWVEGHNLLRDAGTYSYNAGDDATQYFGGTAGHNTVQFDGRDQMPRLSRFLFGDWLKAQNIMPVTEASRTVTAGAGYTDSLGATHHRVVILSDHELRVEDEVSGFGNNAMLRWRLQPGEWKLDGDVVRQGERKLRVTATVPIMSIALTEGWESRYYLKKEKVPVLEVEIRQAGRITTTYHFKR